MINNSLINPMLVLGLSVVVLTAYVLKYKDYNMINNSLLEEIKMQNHNLQQSMQIFQVRKQNKI